MFVVMVLLLGAAWKLQPGRADALQTLEHLTPTYPVDKIYPSLQGPQYTNTSLLLTEGGPPELLWVRGYQALMVGADGWTAGVANFMPRTPDRGYMEAVMDWHLAYRTPDQLAGLDVEVDGTNVDSKRLFIEGEGNIAFLELRKV